MTVLQMNWEWPGTFITIALTIAIAIVAHIIVIALINRITKRMQRMASEPQGTLAYKAANAIGTAAGVSSGRTIIHVTAVAHLLKSVWTFVLILVVILTIMSTLGVPLSPLLASAGIGGVVLAFGAQSLIKDYLSGILMIVEDQYGVGDQIKVGDVTGTVEDITLRITKLRDPNGMIWYIRNGEILRVGNISQGYSTGLIDLPVAYDADVNKVTEVLSQVVDEVSNQPEMTDQLLAPPELLGVESITPTAVIMRIVIKTPPNKQYALARDIRERALAALAAAGIPGPATPPTTDTPPA